METKELGGTGLVVSRLGLGLAALGRPGYINLGHATDLAAGRDVGAMEARAHEVLDAAFDAGVRYFDAARWYGRAEEFLASWLRARGLARGDVVVGSKWGYTYTAGWTVDAERHEVKDHSLATLRQQAEESRDFLGPWLNLYQIHSATRESGVLEDEAVLRELARLKGEGWKVGLSVTGPRQAETILRAIDVEVDGTRVFDTVQATWNILETSAGPALAQAHAAGMGVINKEALANGRLTRSNQAPDFRSIRRRLEGEAGRIGTSLENLGLAVALANPWVDVVLSGASTIPQVRANIDAEAISREALDSLDLAGIAESPEVYWKTRARLPWN